MLFDSFKLAMAGIFWPPTLNTIHTIFNSVDYGIPVWNRRKGMTKSITTVHLSAKNTYEGSYSNAFYTHTFPLKGGYK